MEGNAPPKLTSISDLDDVRLIVKSANQQSEDLIVHSNPSWTIRRLKMHLSQVYPSNPTVPEQKLIYSGQLLSDELMLKDIIRSYKDVETENHIFHLVYTPKISATKPKLPEPTQPLLSNKKQEQKLEKPITPVIPASSSTDGLRHRNVASSSSSTPLSAPSSTSTSTPSNATEAPASTPTAAANAPQQQIPNIPYPFSIPQVATAAGCPNIFPNMTPFSFPGQINNIATLEQQIAMQIWVQQVYVNYMEQCLKMANATIDASQMQPIAPSIPMFMPMPQYMQSSFPTLQQTSFPTLQPTSFPTLQTTAPIAANNVPPEEYDGPGTSRAARANFAPRVVPVIPPPAQQPQPAAAPTVGTAAAPAPAPAPAPAENVEQPQPRFPNIVQEEQDNRDWLDSFYSVTRLLALLTLVYFYSSPLRCLVVAIIAFGIYLYHNGFFQTRRARQANNRNINNNQNINDNNAPAAAPAGDAAPAQETPQVATEANQSTAGGDSEPLISSVTPPESETSTTSLIAFVRTFVVSFFASLLPETPAL